MGSRNIHTEQAIPRGDLGTPDFRSSDALMMELEAGQAQPAEVEGAVRMVEFQSFPTVSGSTTTVARMNGLRRHVTRRKYSDTLDSIQELAARSPDSHHSGGSTATLNHRKQRKLHQKSALDGLDKSSAEVTAATGSGAFKLGKHVFGQKEADFTDVRDAYRMQRVQERSVGQSPTRNIVFTWLSAVYVAKEIYAHSLRSLRRRLILGVTLDLLVDLMFCILYLIEFEIDRNHRDRVADLSPSWLYVARPSTLWNMELSCSSYMVWSQINKIIIADSKREAMFNHRIALDLFICAPFLFLPLYEYGHYVYIPFYLRAVVVVNRIQNVIRLAASRKWIWVEPYTERLVFLISTILALMYVASCAFQYFETRFAEQEITLSQALYFIVITASTVGYGDVSPKSIPGQFVVIVFIILAISILPGLISQTIETLHLRNSGRGTYQRGKSPFVVFVGNFSKTISVIDIIHTFVAREQDRPLNLVFMGRDEPSAAVKAIVRREGFTHRCTYLQGNVLEVQDMERAQIQHAAAAFIIADRNAPDHLIEDDENTLRAWAIDDHAPDVPLFVYNLLPETEILQTHSANEAVCIDNLKQILIGFNLIYRGIGTVLLNLLVQTKPRREYEAPWEAQYGDGLGNELYSGPVNPVFYGFEFQRASYFLFRQYQVICFAVRAVLDNGETHLILNPAGYKLGKKDLLYYVAQRQEDIDDIAHLGREELGFCLQMPNPHSFILEPGCVRQGSMQAVIGENKGQDGNKTMNGWRVGVPVVAQGGVKLPLCLLLKHPIRNLDELLLQDGSHLTNHILVCTGDKHVFRLLCTLRAAHLSDDEFRTVVVLCSTLPNAYEISLFGQFPEVYIVQGDPRKRAELQKAGIHGADKVVVMNMNRKSVNADGVEGFDTFADSAAIMVSHNIYHMFQNTGDHKFTVTELLKRSHVRFLQPADRRKKHRRKKAVHSEERFKADLGIDRYLYSPTYAAGRVISASMLDSILFETYFNEGVLDIFKLMCGGRHKRDSEMDAKMGIDPSFLCYIDVPEDYVGQTFISLYHELSLNQGVIPLGLLRAPDVGLGNTLPFVFTNPLPSIVLKASDLIYALAHIA